MHVVGWRRRLRILLACLAVVGLGFAGWHWQAPLQEYVSGFKIFAKQESAPEASRRTGGSRGGPVPVEVAVVQQEDVLVYREGIGNVAALNNAIIRSQVDGRLISVEFKEGQDVDKGAVLARIDPTLYQAAYDQAVAKKSQDEATLDNARIDLERYRRLAKDNAGPKQQADQQEALVRQLEAQVKSDLAAIDSAQATLGYTTITAPFDGRIGLRNVDPGNIVHASDSNGIATLAQVKPITAIFTLPQRDLDIVATALKSGTVAVEAMSTGGAGVLATGQLAAIDNQIDVSTGTFRLKATFANHDLKLWPGQYITVRAVVDTLHAALAIPTAAVRRGSIGTFVYAVGDDQTVNVRNVDVVMQDDVRAVIGKGLAVGTKVVTLGFAQLSDGARVQMGDGAQQPGTQQGAKPADGERKEHRRRGGKSKEGQAGQ